MEEALGAIGTALVLALSWIAKQVFSSAQDSKRQLSTPEMNGYKSIREAVVGELTKIRLEIAEMNSTLAATKSRTEDIWSKIN